MTDIQACRLILAFLSTRCDVSSQHKLPCLAEVLDTFTAELIGRERTARLISEMISDGRLIDHDGYVSDHPVDIL